MQLWERIFHDRHEYVSMLFENYFDESLCAWHEEDGKIVASIMGIPYKFIGNGEIIDAIYYCGIATDIHYRRKGLMTALLKEIENKTKDRFDFAFLIPSDETNRLIYYNKGYFNAIYKVYEYYTPIHDFHFEFETLLLDLDNHVGGLKKKYYDNLTVEIYNPDDPDQTEAMSEFIMDHDRMPSSFLQLDHTEKDIKVDIEDSLINEAKIFLIHNPKKELKGLMFTFPTPDGRIKVYTEYCKEICAYYKILDAIKKYYAEMALTVVSYPEEVRGTEVWSEFFIEPNAVSTGLESVEGTAPRIYNRADMSSPYGMLKIFNLERVLSFLSYLRNDVKFEVLIKNETGGDSFFVSVKNGKCEIKKLEGDWEKIKREYKSVTILKEKDFMDILFRRRKREDIIMEAFGIPRLPINVTLMSD